jgi:hypothetical protein
MEDSAGKRNGMVWVDGIDRYVPYAAAYAFEALGNHVRWYEVREQQQDLHDIPVEDIRLPYKD